MIYKKVLDEILPKNAFKIAGNWKEHAKHLKEKFPELSFKDLELIPGNEIKLLDRLRLKLGGTRMEVINLIRMGLIQA